MHAITILQRCAGPLLAGVRRCRLAVLFEAVAPTVIGPRLTVTEIARRFAGGRADGESPIFAALGAGG